MLKSVGRTIKLNSGHECPLLGYGTFQSTDAAQLKAGVKAAVLAGYRHIDTAHVYQNEHVIGETLQELYDAGTVKREDLFLTTKVFGTHFKPDVLVNLCKKQVAKLRTSHIDLYLLHFPVAFATPENENQLAKMTPDGKFELDLETKLEETWAAMEKCVELGLTRSIGISNFNISQTQRLIKSGKIKPAMNQVELHPGFQNSKLVQFCQKNGIAVTAYSQFGSPGTINPMTGKEFIDANYLKDEKIAAIGKKYGKNNAQVILRWLIQKNIVAIPKSVTPSRVAENFNIWDFELNEADMKLMAAHDKNKRFSWLDYPGVQDHPEYPHKEEGSC